MGPIPRSPSLWMRNCSPHLYISVINVYPSPKAGYDWNCPFFFLFFFFSLFVRHAMGNKCILCFRSVLAAITRLYGEVLVRKKMNKKNERKTSICTLRPRVSRAESFPSLCYRSIHAVRHGNVYSILMDLWYICQFGISRT